MQQAIHRIMTVFAMVSMAGAIMGYGSLIITTLFARAIEMLLYPLSLIAWIVVSMIVMENIGMRQWSAAFYVGHCAFIVMLVIFALPYQFVGNNTASWWYGFLFVESPLSWGVLCLPEHRGWWALYLSLIGSLQYAAIGWWLDQKAHQRSACKRQDKTIAMPPSW